MIWVFDLFSKLQKQAGPPAVVDGVAVAKRGAPKPAQKKVTVKPKPEEVIDISSEEEVKKEDKSIKKKKEGDGNLRKNSRTLTSVLTARSKAACGVTKKPKEQIVDIDAADTGDELAAVEYIEDIYKFYKLVEVSTINHISLMSLSLFMSDGIYNNSIHYVYECSMRAALKTIWTHNLKLMRG